VSKWLKVLSAMRHNPRGDWRIEDLIFLADRFDIPWRRPGTSHVTFAPDGLPGVTVPAHKPIKPVYVRQFVAMLDTVREAADEGHGD
jgi:hypothetical protein